MPDVFRSLCLWFHQDVFEICGSIAEAVRAFAEQLDLVDKMELRGYVASLIDGNLSDEDIGELWLAGGAQIYVVGEGSPWRRLLAEVLGSLDDAAREGRP